MCSRGREQRKTGQGERRRRSKTGPWPQGATAEQAISQRRHDTVGDQLEGAVGDLRRVRPERQGAICAQGLLRTELQAERAEAEELEGVVVGPCTSTASSVF